MRKAVYPGSFDPITKGHLDIIRRSEKLFDELVIGIFINGAKDYWFTLDERIDMIERLLKKENINAKVIGFDGLLVDFMKKENCNILIRGLRAVSDFEYELQFSLTNEILAKSEFETIFLNASREYLYLSSSIVKEIALNDGELSEFINKEIIKDIENKVKFING